MNVSFQGKHGAYSDLAARALYPEAQTLPCETFEAALNTVHEGKADIAMIPVDNSIAGRVADVHHLLPGSDLYIIGETYQPIKHCLLGLPGTKLKDISDVYSHLHALPQCRQFIRKHNLTPHVAGDTAGAARMVAKRHDPSKAAIASALAAEIYGLEILADGIEDTQRNTTRFLALSKRSVIPEFQKSQDYITTLVFKTRNIPAALYKSLGGFATNGVNLSKLESYIADHRFTVSQFYCDLEVHVEEKRYEQAIEELAFYASEIKQLGCYKRAI